MHRETLSRTLLYSHNILGKSFGSLACNRKCSSSKVTAELLLSRQLQSYTSPLSPSRRYHRSWENPAQSVVETKVLSTTATMSIADDQSGAPVVKKFNIKAKDILSTEDDSPPLKSSAMISRDELLDLPLNSAASVIDSKILAARTVEQLLSLTNEKEMTLRSACILIARLGSLVQQKADPLFSEIIRTDRRFLQTFNLIQRGNHSQYPHVLLQALNGLQKLGLEDSAEVSRLLERELSWSMRRCPLKFLAKSVRILQDNADRELRSTASQGGKDETILQAAIKVLRRRWIEAITGSDFISLFQVIELFDDDRKLKIEERAADVAHQFTPPEILKMFVVLGVKKRRPTPLLRTLSFHFSKSDFKCNAKEGIELIYSLNELTFAEPILMNKVCGDISEEILSIKNVAVISSLMTSLGQMRYKQKDVLLAVDDWIMKRIDSLRVFDYAAWLQAAATLNHSSQNLPIFCKAAQRVLTQSTVSSPSDWVNIVHAFATLSHLQHGMLSSVLNPKFVKSIENLGPKATKQKIKLLNLNFLAKREKGYDGLLLPDSTVKEWSEIFVNSSDEKLSKVVVESLATFLPPQKYLELSCALPSGAFIDAKCYLDNKMMPVTLDVANSKSSKEVQKIAFVVEGYPSICTGLKHRTGQTSLNMRLLEADGFVVISVPYTEFGLNDKLVRRVQYLEQKLKSISQTSDASFAVK